MTTTGLSSAQERLVASWLPEHVVIRDHSWGLVGTTVLEVRHGGERFVVKAGDERDHHADREIAAHRSWLGGLAATDHAPELVRADPTAKLLVTRFLEGELVQGTEHEWAPETYAQAGALLARLHAVHASTDETWEARQDAKALAWLDGEHPLDRETVDRVRAEIASWPSPPARVVPTHGDFHPRNWLAHRGQVRLIDFGRAELRPAETDLTRLEAQQFRADPALEAAFLEGYDGDPRDPEASRRRWVREGVGTACWAHQVGDVAFQEQGLRMLAEALGASA